METPVLQRFLREPLLHFIAIGGLFFLIYTVVNDTYDNSTNPELVLNPANGALTIRDAAAPLGANLLEVQNSPRKQGHTLPIIVPCPIR